MRFFAAALNLTRRRQDREGSKVPSRSLRDAAGDPGRKLQGLLQTSANCIPERHNLSEPHHQRRQFISVELFCARPENHVLRATPGIAELCGPTCRPLKGG